MDPGDGSGERVGEGPGREAARAGRGLPGRAAPCPGEQLTRLGLLGPGRDGRRDCTYIRQKFGVGGFPFWHFLLSIS